MLRYSLKREEPGQSDLDEMLEVHTLADPDLTVMLEWFPRTRWDKGQWRVQMNGEFVAGLYYCSTCDNDHLILDEVGEIECPACGPRSYLN